MKKLKSFIAIIMTVIFTLTSAFATAPDKDATAKVSSESKITDRFIVKYKQDNHTDKIEESMSKEVKNLKKLKNKKYNALQTNKKMSVEELIEVLEMQGVLDEIEYIQEDNIIETLSNDPYFNEQWGLQNSTATVTGEVYGIDANISEVWDITQGESTVVGVIDTGIDINHEDLKNNIWINSGEIPGDGIDQDGNGYVDDVNGWNFAGDSNDVYDENDSMDEGHGTALAGIIAAEKDNGAGIAGIAPKAKVMPLKVFKNGQAYTSDIIEAIEYAKASGVKIVNCSWGTGEVNQALKDAIADSGILFVCAAGNNGAHLQQSSIYPACFGLDNIISVASVNSSGNLSSFSNYSSSILDIAAPGEEIISTIPGNQYSKKNGTSVSVAFVSGEAALVMSSYKEATVQEVKNRILDNADKIAALEGKVKGGSRINYIAAVTGNTVTPVSETNSGTVTGTVYGDEYGFSLMSMEDGYSAPQDVTAPVFSLPSNTANGQMKMSIMGNTVVNLLGDDGNCEDVSKYYTWQASLALDTANKQFGANGIKITTTGDIGCALKNVLDKIDKTKHYCLSAYLKNGDATNIRLEIGKSSSDLCSSFITENSKFTRSIIKISPSYLSTITDSLRILVTVRGTATGQYGYVDGIMLNEITEAEYNDSNYNPPDYVNGIKSTNTLGIKSVGKNLVRNGNGEEGLEHWIKLYDSIFTLENNKFSITSKTYNYEYVYQKVKVKKNTSYAISPGILVRGYDGYDGTSTWMNTALKWGYDGNRIFNTGTYSEVIVIMYGDTVGTLRSFDHVQLEEGTITSAYEPYYESISYLLNDVELNSLPNGIRDEINLYKGIYINRIDAASDGTLTQLAQPSVSKIDTQPLTCFENGTITVENTIKAVSSYNSGIFIKNANLPIKEIESIYKIDGALRTPVSTGIAAIASDGLSFTITGAQNGDIYEYVYRYADELSTLPVIRYSVPTDSTSQSNSNVEAINALQSKVDNLEQRVSALEELIKNGIGSKTIEFQYDVNGNLQAIIAK